MTDRIVILGAGQAGAQAAASLRQHKFDGEIVLAGAETAPPYQRPPLSKAYLKGKLDEDRLHLRPLEFYQKERIELLLGAGAVALDCAAKRIAFSDGKTIAYDRLLLATGAPPRKLNAPGAELPGVRYLRNLKDSDALRLLLTAKTSLVIVGAGYVGLEVAAVARAAGLHVTVLEAADRPLARVAGPELSAFFIDLHQERGVEFRFGDSASGFEGSDALEAVVLKSGARIPCAAALIGIGAEPASGLAAAAGLAVDNGIIVDEFMRTADASVFAVGDVANFPSRLYGRRMRIESVPNAIDQAKTAAANLAGQTLAHDATPWFWSDQYDVKLQTAGIFTGADQTIVRRNGARQMSVWYLQDERLLAVDAVNDPSAFAVGKRLVAAKAALDAKTLADPATELKSLIR